MKRNPSIAVVAYRVVTQLSQTLPYWLLKHTAGLVMGLPYLVWRTLFPKRRYGNRSVSRTLRRLFESRKTRRVIGIHLMSALIGFVFIQYPVIATDVSSPNLDNHLFIEFLSSNVVMDTTPRFRAPVPGYISQPFHAYHPGVDIAGNDYRLVYPISHGKIVMIEQSSGGYGLSIMIDHGNGLISRYAHLDHISVDLNDKVTLETALGAVGNTGWTTGAHLHLEVYDNGIAIDPLTMFAHTYAQSYINLAVAPDISESTPSSLLAAPQIVAGTIPTLEATISAQTIKVYAEGFIEPQAYSASPSVTFSDQVTAPQW